MLGDQVKIVKSYCADKIYVGLEGMIVEEFNDLTHGRKIRVKIPKNDKRYYLGNEPIFPLSCIETMPGRAKKE